MILRMRELEAKIKQVKEEAEARIEKLEQQVALLLNREQPKPKKWTKQS